MAKKRKNLTKEYFMDMVDEASDYRAEVLGSVIGLLDANAVESIKALLLDSGAKRFLLEDEVDFLRLYIQKRDPGPNMLN